MDINNLQKNWNEFGKNDPLWAILTAPDKKGRKWKTDEFFKTGEIEIDEVLKYVHSLNINIQKQKALDFGCGVGRLTQALANYFEIYGVDIAPSMIKDANKYNKFGDKCHYLLNEKENLKLFEDNTFDFIYSRLVLQHMKPEYSIDYIKDFLRILNIGGVAIFQIPSEIKTKISQQNPSPYKAQITPTKSISTMEAGSQNTLHVKIKNISNFVWSVSDRIRLGNHWLDLEGNVLLNDDARADLPKDLMPGDEVELPLIINPPRNPGIYIMELDMVKESVTWFYDQGSEKAKFNVEIISSSNIKQFIYSKAIRQQDGYIINYFLIFPHKKRMQ